MLAAVQIFLVSAIANSAVGIISDRVARNGDYPSAVAILNGSEVTAMGLLVSRIHVFTACRIVGYFLNPNDIITADLMDYDGSLFSTVDTSNGTAFHARNFSMTYLFRPYNVDNVTLVAGSKWIYELEGGQSRNVGNSYVHPDCETSNGPSRIIRHNVGVFEARESFIVTSNLIPMKLWSERQNRWYPQYRYLLQDEIRCTVAGWGQTKNKPYSERLLVADVKLVPDEHCIKQFCEWSSHLCEDLKTNFHKEGKLCVANVGSSHPCYKDIGAALYCENYAYGILSNIFNCSRAALSVIHGIHWSIDLYYTAQLEASTASSKSGSLVLVAVVVLMLRCFYCINYKNINL